MPASRERASLPLIGIGYGAITVAIIAVSVAGAMTALGVLDGAALATLLGTVVSYFFARQQEGRTSGGETPTGVSTATEQPGTPSP